MYIQKKKIHYDTLNLLINYNDHIMNNNDNIVNDENYILKLVNLYQRVDLRHIPNYLLNNKKFMLYRIINIKNQEYKAGELSNIFNKFKTDKEFYSELFDILNSNFKIVKKIKSMHYFINMSISNNDELIDIAMKKYPHILFFLNKKNINNKYINDDLLRYLYKYSNNYNISNNRSSLFMLKENDKIFEIIKYVPNFFNYNLNEYINIYDLNKYYDNIILNKILLNLLSLIKNRDDKVCFTNITNVVFLQFLKNNKNILIINNNFLSYYCTIKYKISFSCIYPIYDFNNIIKRNKYLDLSSVNNKLQKDRNYIFKTHYERVYENNPKLDEYYDLIFLILRNNLVKENIFLYFGNFCENFYLNKYLIKRISNYKGFEPIKYLFKYLYNNKILYNINYIKKLKNFLNHRIWDNLSINIIFKYMFASTNPNEILFYRIDDIDIKIIFNKKLLEKILYYYPKFIRGILHYLNKRTKVLKSSFIHYENIYSCVPFYVDINSTEFDKYINKKNYHDIKNFDYYNKEEMIKFCSKINFGILKRLPHFKNDYDIVSISVKKDEKMIRYADVNYINKYVENNFDINLTLEKMKK